MFFVFLWILSLLGAGSGAFFAHLWHNFLKTLWDIKGRRKFIAILCFLFFKLLLIGGGNGSYMFCIQNSFFLVSKFKKSYEDKMKLISNFSLFKFLSAKNVWTDAVI